MKQKLYMAIITMGAWILVNPALSNELPYDRVIHLDGTANTRDIGGYLTNDLRTLRWRQIIRSENLSRLTANDFKKLEELGLKTIIDLRTDKEHDRAPTVWLGDNPPQFFHFPVGDSNNDWFSATRKMMKDNKFTEEQSSKLMVEGYRMIVEEGPPSYEKLMEVVLDQSNWPILIHCNAGKDRAGVAVTLILEALSVDRETIMEEFLLTNEIARIEKKAVLLSKESKKLRRNGRGPSADAWFPVIGVQAEMLESFYASVNEKYGSMDAFLTEIGVAQDARMTLAASLTTEQPILVMSE
jgi:protein-tyrosine phosphatase